MPSAKKPVSQSPLRSPATFTEPAALKQLTTKSLDAAQEALAHMRKDTGRDVGPPPVPWTRSDLVASE